MGRGVFGRGSTWMGRCWLYEGNQRKLFTFLFLELHIECSLNVISEILLTIWDCLSLKLRRVCISRSSSTGLTAANTLNGLSPSGAFRMEIYCTCKLMSGTILRLNCLSLSLTGTCFKLNLITGANSSILSPSKEVISWFSCICLKSVC